MSQRITKFLVFATVGLSTGSVSLAQAPKVDGAQPPYKVKVIADLPYHDGAEADPAKQKLNLFLPEGLTDFPVVMFIHGGAWSSGDRRLYFGLGQNFARNGIGAVLISYRLSPKVHHPAHIEDVARAFAWTHTHIGEYGGRPDEIFVTGQSAGGHLAALLATNDRYLRPFKLSAQSIKGVMPISGVYVFRTNRFERVLGSDPGAAESASPLRHVTGKEPPFLIMYADGDFPTCDTMSRDLCNALRARNVEAELKEIPGRNHLSIIARPLFDEKDPVMQAMLNFISHHSRNRPPDAPAASNR